MTRAHDAYAALRLPSFRRYLGFNTALFIGLQMQSAAVSWEIYERTGSPLHLGYINLARFLPSFLLLLVAGHVTDTYNRKRVLMGAIALTAVAALGLAWNSATEGPILVTYVCVALTGAARAFWFPARASFLPRIVPRDIFTNAISWNSTFFELSGVAGPAVAGAVIGFLKGASVVYLINGIGGVIALFLILGIPYLHETTARQPLSMQSLLVGFRYIRRTQVILAAMTLDMFGVLVGGATAMMPIFAKDILAVGPDGLGWLLAAPAIGAGTMAMIQARRLHFARPGRALLFAVAGFGGATILFGLSRNFWFSMAMLLILGMCDNVSVVVRSTLIQMLTPDDMRGRVSSINGLFIVSSNDLGGYESAMVASLLTPVWSVVSGGLGTLVVVAVIAWVWPQLRNYGDPEKAEAMKSS